MSKSTLLLLSGSFPGFASYVEPGKRDALLGGNSQKGPPGIKTVGLAFLKGTGRTIVNYGSSTHNAQTIQVEKVNINELLDEIETGQLYISKKQNGSVGYKANYPGIIIKENEFNQIKIYENN